MGCMQSLVDKHRSRAIDRYLQKDVDVMHKEVILLLLGVGGSGTSTIMKQIKIIFDGGYLEEERIQYRQAVYVEIILTIFNIALDMERLGIDFGDVSRVDDFWKLPVLASNIGNDVMSEELVGVIHRLWQDEGVQTCFSLAPEHKLSGRASYYLKHLDRISRVDYIPSQEDVVWALVRTTGIEEMCFRSKEQDYRVISAGQPLSNLRKWAPCFEDIPAAAIFCVALSDYDQLLDDGTNRMHDSMRLFNSVCNSNWFRESKIFVLFNKKDLFEQKISRIPLTTCFPEYSGANTFEEAADYIANKFVSLNQMSDNKEVSVLFACATDMENVSFVIDRLTDIIVEMNRPRIPMFLV